MDTDIIYVNIDDINVIFDSMDDNRLDEYCDKINEYYLQHVNNTEQNTIVSKE